jgi:3-hydroxybutyryl-CoA dehydrogenase
MKLVVLADEPSRKEFLHDVIGNCDIMWIKDVEEFSQYKNADGFFDLLFDGDKKRIELLKNLSPKPIIVNAVLTTLEEMKAPFIRLNGWPGFLQRPLAEASFGKNGQQQAEKIFSSLNKELRWVADQPGFVTARVVATIINEAYFAVGGGVSTKEEVDIAMKLGTNYPFGPFEWCTKIGIKNIFSLLTKLAITNSRYKPAELLKKEAMA